MPYIFVICDIIDTRWIQASDFFVQRALVIFKPFEWVTEFLPSSFFLWSIELQRVIFYGYRETTDSCGFPCIELLLVIFELRFLGPLYHQCTRIKNILQMMNSSMAVTWTENDKCETYLNHLMLKDVNWNILDISYF